MWSKHTHTQNKIIIGCLTQTAGVPYMEQNHLHGKRQEFRIRNNAQKTKEHDVKTILFNLAYLTLIKLLFSMSAGIGLPSGQCYKH